MATLFALLFFVALIATVVILVKPSFTQIKNRAALPRKKIALYGFSVSLFLFAMIGIFAPKVENVAEAEKPIAVEPKPEKPIALEPKHEEVEVVAEPVKAEPIKSQAEIDKDAEQYRVKIEKQQQDLADEDRPHLIAPPVDYTTAISKVDLSNDKAILSAVKKPLFESEKSTNQNGEPMTIYYFSKELSSGLELSLSREFVDVAWQYDNKNLVKAAAIFKDGQRVTRALLGGKDGADLYEKISKGQKFESLTLDDGTVIKNARCGSSICRYQVVR